MLAVLRGNPATLRETFSELRSHAEISQFDELVANLCKNSFYRGVLLPQMRPHAPTAIKQHQPLLAQGLERELAWAVSIIGHYATDIQQFLCHKKQVVKLCIGGAYEKALEQLEAVEANFGPSLWAFALRLLLQEIISGQDENNRTYTQLRENKSVNAFAYFMLFYLGFRTTAGATAQLVRTRVPDARGNRPLAFYLSNRLAPFAYGDGAPRLEDIESSLRLETNSTVIDLYQALIRAIGFCIDLRQGPATRELGRRHARRLAERVGDPALLALDRPMLLANDGDGEVRARAFLEAYDRILLSRDDADEALGDALHALGWRFEGSSPTDPICSGLSALRKLVGVAGPRETHALEFERVCMMFAETEEAQAIYGIAKWLYTGMQTLSIFGSLPAVWMSGLALPDFAEFMDSDRDAVAYLDAYERHFGPHLCIDAQWALRGYHRTTLPPTLDMYVRALAADRAGNRTAALRCLDAAYRAR